MDRVNGLNWTDIGAGRRGFRGRDAANGLAGTELTAAWLNAMQEELAFIAGLSGAALDPLKWTQVAEGIRCGKLNYLVPGGTGAAYVATMTPIPAAYGSLLGGTFQLVPPVDNTGPVTLAIGDLGALPILRQDGLPLKAGDLIAGRPVLLTLLPGLAAWQIFGWLPSFTKRKLEADLDLYVNSATGNDNNPGTAAAPFRTLDGAASYARQKLDLNGFNLVFRCAGTFAGLALNGGFTGQSSILQVKFALGTSQVQGSTTSAFSAGIGAMYHVDGGVLTASGTGAGQGCALAPAGGVIGWSNVTFGTCSIAHIAVSNGGFAAGQGASYSVTGGAQAHLLADNGTIDANLIVCTLTGTPAFGSAFAVANGGNIGAVQMTFAGAATGKRYSADVWGSIFVGGAGANYFPGSAAGLVTAQGDYR